MQVMTCVAEYAPRVTGALKLVNLRRGFTVTYLVVILKHYATYNAFVPDVPGCIALSTSLDTVRKDITEGLALHLSSLVQAGAAVPQPQTSDIATVIEEGDEVIEIGSVSIHGTAEF